MRVLITLLWMLSMVGISTPAVSQSGPTTLSGKIAREFRVFQKKRGTRSFATNGVNAFGYFYDAINAEIAEEYALRSCEKSREKASPRAAN